MYSVLIHILRRKICKKEKFGDDKDRSHKNILIEFIDLLVRRSIIITYNTRSPRKIQTTTIAAATTHMNQYKFSNTKSSLQYFGSVCYSGERKDYHHIKHEK